MTGVVWAALTGVLHLAVVALVVGPLAWWGAHRRGRPALGEGAGPALLLGSAVYVGSHVLLALPRVGPFADLAWNWQNKVLLALALVALVATRRDLSWRQVGLTSPAPDWWRLVLAATAGTVAFQAIVGPMGDVAVTAETVAYQALIPGLDEELLFRGVLLVVFDRVWEARTGRAGSDVGWGAAITTLLFGLVHGLTLDEGAVVSFDPAAIIMTGAIGALLLWVRVRTASLWPAILLHNAINLSVVAATALTR